MAFAWQHPNALLIGKKITEISEKKILICLLGYAGGLTLLISIIEIAMHIQLGEPWIGNLPFYMYLGLGSVQEQDISMFPTGFIQLLFPLFILGFSQIIFHSLKLKPQRYGKIIGKN